MRSFILLFLSQSLSKGFNLIGNTYLAHINVPLTTKKQSIKIYFVDNNKANLKLDGFINKEGNIDYNYDEFKKTFYYTPDKNIENVMKKYLLNLYDIFYNETSDKPVITIKSKLLRIKQKIIFNNIKEV